MESFGPISVISDPRQAWKAEHSLTDIIFLMLTAVIAGAEGWEDFGEDNLQWLQQYGDFGNGIP
ncbi:transposase family protein, partial [Vibrio anguillarum]|uniref:transposase family protein n=1 Tax=Vibrio anguillarum TaxID=55601 RepID=UPI001F1B37FC